MEWKEMAKKKKPKKKPIPGITAEIEKIEKEVKAEIVEEKDNVPKSVGRYNDVVINTHVPEEIVNSYENYQVIKKRLNHWRKSKRPQPIGALKSRGKGPILVLASGPSLDSALPLLKEWRGALICTSSHATSCVHAGKDPTYILSLDHRDSPSAMHSNYWYGRDTAVIIHPAQAPAFVKYWKGRTYYFRKLIREVPFHARVMPAAYGKMIPDHLYVFSSSLPAQLGLAYMAGYSPMFLIGCDFGIDRFRKWTYEKRNKWLPRMMPFGKWTKESPHSAETEGLVRTFSGILTNEIQLYYKRATICGCRLDLGQIILADDGKGTSILEEFPKASLEQVIEYQGQGFENLYRTEDEMRDVYDKYLITKNTFPIPVGPLGTGEGTIFQEFHNWRHSMPQYIDELIKSGAKTDKKEILDRFDKLEYENKLYPKWKTNI